MKLITSRCDTCRRRCRVQPEHIPMCRRCGQIGMIVTATDGARPQPQLRGSKREVATSRKFSPEDTAYAR